MISSQQIEDAKKGSENFKPAILSARYHRAVDRVELVTAWCVLLVDRARIDELRDLSQDDLETLTASAVGVHVDNADIDINSAALITDISHQLETEVAASF